MKDTGSAREWSSLRPFRQRQSALAILLTCAQRVSTVPAFARMQAQQIINSTTVDGEPEPRYH